MGSLEEAILKEEQRYFESNVVEPTHIVMRPESRVKLAEELGMTWDFNLNEYMGLKVCVCDADDFPDFKLGTW